MIKVFKTKDLLADDLPYSGVEYDKIVDQTRWNIYIEIVFKRDGKYWRTIYSTNDESTSWEHVDEVNCTEVELKEVVRERWVVV